MSTAMLITLTIFAAVYVGLVSERLPRYIVVLCGVLALLFSKIITIQEAFAYINGRTLLYLFGLFIAVEALSVTGFFEHLSSALSRRFERKPATLFFVLPLLAGSLSMGVNNITVMAFMTTLTLAICQYLSLEPVPVLIGEVTCANMMGAATLIGAPPNLIMATTLSYSFSRVSIHMAPIAVVCTLLFMTIHYLRNRKSFLNRPADSSERLLSQIPDPDKTLLLRRFFKLDYGTLLFFAGLFVLVGALEHVGLFQTLAKSLAKIQNPLLLMFVILWGSAIISGFVDNVPMALAMAYLIKKLGMMSPTFPSGILVWAALIGLTLGGNMTPIGASPNIVCYGILEKQNTRMGWKKWAAMTVPATLIALAAASLLLWAKFRLGWY